MKKNKISKNWLNKKHKDPFFIKSKLQGYRSRAAFKLIEINNKFKFLNKNTILLDLGSSPGGWSQVASDIIKKGKILSVDILEMENIRNVNFLKGDFFSEEIFKKICNFFNNKVDVVISDMAANTSGNKNLDSYRTGELCMNAMDLAKKVMHKDGVFVSKVFMGSIFTEIDAKAKKNFKKVNPLICFAVKANNNTRILKEIAKLGLGADVVSKGELMAALKSKIDPKKIVFSGVGKTYQEIEFATKKKVLLINAESQSEIETILKIARKVNRVIDIGIRLNPNVDAKTIKEITTGKTINKFGLTEKEVIGLINHYKKSKYLNIKCLSVHIGSQITSHIPYLKMLKAVQKIIDKTKFNFKYIQVK